jgi:hypothetical protein
VLTRDFPATPCPTADTGTLHDIGNGKVDTMTFDNLLVNAGMQVGRACVLFPVIT